MRVFSQLLRFALFALIGILLLICVGFALLQTKWAKEQIREKIVIALNQADIAVSAEELSGKPPFSWTLKQAKIKLGDGNELTLSQIKLRIAILPLLRGKLAINYFHVQQAEYTFSSQISKPCSFEELKSLVREQLTTLILPCQIAIQHLVIDRIALNNQSENTSLSFSVLGKAMLRKDSEEFAFDLHLRSLDQQSTYLDAEFVGSKSRNLIELKLSSHLESLPSLLCQNLEGKCAFNLRLKGPWTSWKETLYDLPRTSSPISGEIKGICSKLNMPNYSLLNCKWKFKSRFSIFSSERVYLKHFQLVSDLGHFQGRGQWCKTLENSQLMVTFSVPHLNLFYPPLSGAITGKALYQHNHAKVSFETSDLKLDTFSAKNIQGLIKANLKDSEWDGEVKLTSQDAELPFENVFAFKCAPQKELSLVDFSFKIPEGNASGSLTYDIAHRRFNGSLFANVEHVNRFSFLNIDGNFAIELQLSSNQKQQDVKLIVLGKDLSYRDLLLDDLTLSAEIKNVFNEPQGRFNLLAEKFYSPNVYLSRLSFNTSSDEEHWPFALDVEGRFETSFEGYARGFWKKDPCLFTVELTQFFGELAQMPFLLKRPVELEWGSAELNLSPLEMRMGQGQLYTRFQLSPIRSVAVWDLTHFPLEMLSCLKPRFTLSGLVTSKGFFDATPENFEGSTSITLEEASVLHFGKTSPFHAHGTLQAHVNQNKVQIHTDLHAVDDQFLDFNATLPLKYDVYPFRLTLNETQPTSAEMIAEGKLEDLFDFVNLGPNHFTGLISTRLFLSHTLAAPSLQGELHWQKGSFENYFTGIALKEIEAQFEANQDVIRLMRLTAKDDRQGQLTAEGKIDLKPERNFPYAFEAEMSHLHALGFDMIDCDLTGPLYLTGNTHQMFAQGNLLIDDATIQITERLPYEIPSLPVTYINRPAHLYTRTLSNPDFTFHLDLELTAEEKVYVEGLGLKAELQGNVHLHGTNTNIVANGALKLIKGEYQFSGKIFKLTEGEILFNDKPTPSAYLNLNGTLSLPEITITAMLNGPLTSPQLTFQSNPQKSTSEILSLILFNKDIAEITHAEAIQLASTLMSLSGGAGPDVLESIRKSIGVDRLNIASRRGAKEGSDEIAVEIGKYLTRGLLITLSQSATSSQVIVELELPHGFVFQAETQEEEEGKFSLKWTKSY